MKKVRQYIITLFFIINIYQQANADNSGLRNQKIPLIFNCKKITASSGVIESNKFNIIDWDTHTTWTPNADSGGVGEWIKIEFWSDVVINRIIVVPYPQESQEVFEAYNRIKKMKISFIDSLKNKTIDVGEYPGDYEIELEGVESSFIKLKINEIYKGNKYNKLSIAEIFLFGRELNNEIPLALEIKKIRTSSELLDVNKSSYYYSKYNIIDTDIKTAWVESSEGFGIEEWIEIELFDTLEITSIGLFSGYGKSENLFFNNCRIKELEILFSNNVIKRINLEDIYKFQRFKFCPVKTSFIKLKIKDIYKGEKYSDLCISELKIYGKKVRNVSLFDINTMKQVPDTIHYYESQLREFNGTIIYEVAQKLNRQLIQYAKTYGGFLEDDAGEGQLLSVLLLYATGIEGRRFLTECMYYSTDYPNLDLFDIYKLFIPDKENFPRLFKYEKDERLIPIFWKIVKERNEYSDCAIYALLTFYDTRALTQAIENYILQNGKQTQFGFSEDCTNQNFMEIVLKYKHSSTKRCIYQYIKDERLNNIYLKHIMLEIYEKLKN